MTLLLYETNPPTLPHKRPHLKIAQATPSEMEPYQAACVDLDGYGGGGV